MEYVPGVWDAHYSTEGIKVRLINFKYDLGLMLLRPRLTNDSFRVLSESRGLGREIQIKQHANEHQALK